MRNLLAFLSIIIMLSLTCCRTVKREQSSDHFRDSTKMVVNTDSTSKRVEVSSTIDVSSITADSVIIVETYFAHDTIFLPSRKWSVYGVNASRTVASADSVSAETNVVGSVDNTSVDEGWHEEEQEVEKTPVFLCVFRFVLIACMYIALVWAVWKVRKKD